MLRVLLSLWNLNLQPLLEGGSGGDYNKGSADSDNIFGFIAKA